MKPTVVLTRPEGNNAALELRLGELGWDVLIQPILQIQALSDEESPPLQPLGQGDLLLFISANAVRMGLPRFAAQLNELPRDALPTFLGVGAATAAAISEFGFAAVTPERPDSEGLLALPELQDVAARRVVIVKGHGGRQILADVLGERGANVEEFVCYRREAVPIDAGEFCWRLCEREQVVFQANSGETLDLLTDLLGRGGQPNLLDSPVILPSERVAERAAELGWGQVIRADNAGDDAFIAALKVLDNDELTDNDGLGPRALESETVTADNHLPDSSGAQVAANSQEPNPPEPAPKARPQVQTAAGSKADWLARTLVLALLLLLGSSGFAAWRFVWPEWQQLKADRASVDDNLRALQAAQDEATATVNETVKTRLIEAERRVANSLEQQLLESATARAESDANNGRLTDRLDRLELRLARLTATDRRAWLTNEAAFLVRLAAQRLLASRDVAAAESLLANADALLAEASDPRLERARRALAVDRTALAVTPKVDTVGLYAQFSALIEQSASLQVVIAPPVKGGSETADKSWLAQAEAGWQAALAKLSDYLVVQRRDREMSRMMTPDWEALARQNLRMLLEQAQIAALSGNQPLYDTALERAGRFVDEFAGADPTRVAVIRTQLKELAGKNISPELPDLLTSRAALADAIRLIDGQAAMTPDAAIAAAEVLGAVPESEQAPASGATSVDESRAPESPAPETVQTDPGESD